MPREVRRRIGTDAAGKALYEGTGRWQGAYRDAAGERHTQVFATRTAARKWENDGAAAVRAGQHRNPRAGRLVMRDWHARWLAARVVEDSTARTDRTYGRDLLAKWDTWPLAAITRMECQAWVAQLVADGRGPTAISKAAQLLMSVLQAAVDEGLIPSNPARGIRLPESSKQPDRILTVEEEASLLEQMPTMQDRRLVELLVDTGLRYGEAAGLHAHRVNMLRRELRVVEVLTQAGQLKAYPKSRKSRRVVPLEDRALLALAAQLEKHPDGLLFRTARGGRPMVETNWRKRAWIPAVTAAGIDQPLPTPHDLRHTALSRLVAEGVDLRTVQEVAGHESITTTMRYMHLMPDAHERVRTALKRVASLRVGADLAQSAVVDLAGDART